MPDRSGPIWFDGRWRRLRWDERKRRTNLAKHGIDFAALAHTFATPYIIEFDEEHSQDEDRWRLVGLLRQDVIVVIMRIDPDAIRLISARHADDAEAQSFFKQCFGS